jgi:hypothetical protein
LSLKIENGPKKTRECVPDSGEVKIKTNYETNLQLLPELDVPVLTGRDDKVGGGDQDMGHHIAVHETLLIVLSTW